MVVMPTTRHEGYWIGCTPTGLEPAARNRIGGALREQARNTIANHPHPHNRLDWGHIAAFAAVALGVLVYAYGIVIWR